MTSGDSPNPTVVDNSDIPAELLLRGPEPMHTVASSPAPGLARRRGAGYRSPIIRGNQMKLVTRMAAMLQPPVRPLLDAALRALRAVVVQRCQMTAMCAREQTCLDSALPDLHPRIRAHLDWLQAELLCSVPPGPVVVTVLIAELPG